MEEKTYYSQGNIVVTSSRVTIHGDNYFVNQIASSKVRYTVETDKMKDFLRKVAIVASIIIGIWIGVASESFALGTFLVIAGIVAAIIFIKPNFKLYHLFLGMSSGEVDAYSSANSSAVHAISHSINEALASRA
jgi:hypothetical protein